MCSRPVLGHISSNGSSHSENHNTRSFNLERHLHSRNSNSLFSIFKLFLRVSLLPKGFFPVGALFRLFAYAGHGLYTFHAELAVGCFSGKHDSVCPIQNGVGHVRSFCSGGSRVIDHGFHHLCGCYHWFAIGEGLLDHPLLSNEHLLWGNFHTQIASGYHNSICGLKDLVEIVQSFLVLDFGDNLYIRPSRTQDVSDIFDVRSFSCEG